MNERDAFEHWAEEKYGWSKACTILENRADYSEFVYATVFYAWEAWQAAQAEQDKQEPVVLSRYAPPNTITIAVDKYERLKKDAEAKIARLQEVSKAGFKLTSQLCMLPTTDRNETKLQRERVMDLVVAWRTEVDQAMKERK
jgi:hypothetical protein